MQDYEALGVKDLLARLDGGQFSMLIESPSKFLTRPLGTMQDYKTPEGKVLSRDLTAVLNTAIQFLVECRPLAVTMGNAIKSLKTQVWIVRLLSTAGCS